MRRYILTFIFVLGCLSLFSQATADSLCFRETLFPGSSDGGTFYLDSIPAGATPTDSTNLVALFIGDSVCVNFDTFPFGGYRIRYMVASDSIPAIIKRDSSRFYHMDTGSFSLPVDTLLCDTTTTFVLSSAFSTFTVGADVTFEWIQTGLDSIQDSTTWASAKGYFTPGVDTATISLVRIPVVPSGYTSTVSIPLDTFTFGIGLFCCTVDTVICETTFVDSGNYFTLEVIPNPTDSVTWTTPDGTTSKLGPADQLSVGPAVDSTFGIYYGTTRTDSCDITYQMEVEKSLCEDTPDSIVCFVYLTDTLTTLNLFFNVDPGGTITWTAPDGDTTQTDTLLAQIFDASDLGTYVANVDRGSCQSIYTIDVFYSGDLPSPMIFDGIKIGRVWDEPLFAMLLFGILISLIFTLFFLIYYFLVKKPDD